jgi:hypothetical protein
MIIQAPNEMLVAGSSEVEADVIIFRRQNKTVKQG